MVRGTSGHCGGQFRHTWRLKGWTAKKNDLQSELSKLLSSSSSRHSRHFNLGLFCFRLFLAYAALAEALIM